MSGPDLPCGSLMQVGNTPPMGSAFEIGDTSFGVAKEWADLAVIAPAEIHRRCDDGPFGTSRNLEIRLIDRARPTS